LQFAGAGTHRNATFNRLLMKTERGNQIPTWMKTYRFCTTKESGRMKPGNGRPLFPSEQFCSLHVMYWEPAGSVEIHIYTI